jgi:hypothetical protein
MVATQQTVRQLQDRIRRLEQAPRAADEAVISSGWPPLDRLLPGGGLRRGSLVEWLGDAAGHGAATLALGSARQAAKDGGVLVVVDRQRQAYPPAIAAWQMDLSHVIFVHPRNQQDEFWAWDQALRCPGVAAVWGWIERIDGRWFRRWQLSAEASGSLGLFLCPGEARAQPSWADVRLLVQPRPTSCGRRLRIELLRCRGAGRGGSVELVLDDWTGQVRRGRERHETYPRALAAQLARAKARPRPTGTDGARGRTL